MDLGGGWGGIHLIHVVFSTVKHSGNISQLEHQLVQLFQLALHTYLNKTGQKLIH
jgi:NADH dehydrogenase FAD-containing subunit